MVTLKDKGQLTHKHIIYLYDDLREAVLDFQELCYYIQLETYGELNYNLQNKFKNLLHKYKISSFNLPNEIELHKKVFGDYEK